MDAKASYQINGLDCPTGAIGAFENIGDFPQLSNQESDPANENPGARAGATGADLHTTNFVSTEYRKPGRSAMSLYAKDSHKRVCRMLGYALTLDDPVTWNQTAAILGHRLTSMELASVAYAVLSALEPETREAVYGAAQWGVA